MRWTVDAVSKLLADYSVAARVEPHEIRGVRRVIVTLDLNRPTLRQPRRSSDCDDL